MKRFYLASGLKNAVAAEALLYRLRGLNLECTYNWLAHGFVGIEGPTRMGEVAAMEIEGVTRADFVVVLLPGGRGSHVELGAALGLDKHVFLIAEDDRMLKVADEECTFYWHPRVTRIIGANAEDRLIDILRTKIPGAPKQMELAFGETER